MPSVQRSGAHAGVAAQEGVKLSAFVTVPCTDERLLIQAEYDTQIGVCLALRRAALGAVVAVVVAVAARWFHGQCLLQV